MMFELGEDIITLTAETVIALSLLVFASYIWLRGGKP